ncbi:MAG TPA: preprotein translocase subunit SecG [Methylophilaceae bacterium]|jgi:preprotein translocase subunit SecG|nr:preprotein translocase subunit SecG [Methylophilaceae bacterium]
MENLIITIHILASLGVIGLVLIQHGKGADAGAAFGGGNSGSVFGVQGSSNFLSRATSICVTTFFCTSIALAVVASKKHGNSSVVNITPETSETLSLDNVSDKPVGAKDIPN